MDAKTYEKEALKSLVDYDTISFSPEQNAILNVLIGLSGEVGEINDIYKKHFFQGHPLDRTKVVKEVGDVLWYINLLLVKLGSNFEEAFEMNIQKLRARYGEQYSDEKSINRKE